MASRVKRTMDVLRSEGAHVSVVERWIPQAKRRIDAFGIFDLIAIHGGTIIGIQVCDRSTLQRHLELIRERREVASAWLSAGGRIEVWFWWRSGRRWEFGVKHIEQEDLL